MAAPSRAALTRTATRQPGSTGNRILVVEDEALVAMALRESFNEMGFVVIGPFSRISEAMNALRTNQVDAAVLDINLGGEMVYPLADVLKAARIPFAFVTGYGAEEVKARYASIPVLQKPVELDALKSIFTVRPRCFGGFRRFGRPPERCGISSSTDSVVTADRRHAVGAVAASDIVGRPEARCVRMVKIAVTGASGFLGRHVLAALARRHRGRERPAARAARPGRCGAVSAGRTFDLTAAPDDAFDRLGRPDIVIHLAWGGLPNYLSPRHLESRASGAGALPARAGRSGPAKRWWSPGPASNTACNRAVCMRT